jgi:uncharacterized protein (TIGR00725 family)
VAVLGPHDASEPLLELARETGALLARTGCSVYTGGLGGVMEAAARGAREAGGLTVGILPGADTAEANEWVQVAVATGLGEARNLVLIRSVEAAIAIGRGYGTLSEIAFALRLSKPVVLLDSWNEVGGHAMVAATPEQAVRALSSTL